MGIIANIHKITKSTMANQADSECTKATSGRSARQATGLNQGCEEWLGELGQEEGEEMMEMGVREDLETYHVSGSRCSHPLIKA